MTTTMTILGSSSRGNNYLLDCGGEHLIIECGVPCDKTLKVLDYDVRNVAGCIVTHKHNDHAKYIVQYQNYFRNIYSTPSVAEKYKGVTSLEPMRKYKTGGFTVLPLKVPHGGCECYSYIIEHESIGRLLFCTDAQTFPYDIKGINHLFIEVNHSDEVILDNIMDGQDIRSQYMSHMSLDTAIEVCRRLYNPRLMNVCAIHLSDSNADERAISERFRSELGIGIRIAENNMSVALNLEEF